MISFKRFLDQARNKDKPDRDLMESLAQMGSVLMDAMATHAVRGRPSDFRVLRSALQDLIRQVSTPQSPLEVLGISSDAVDALETYCQNTTEYLRQEREQLNSMVSLLTATVADLSGQANTSIDRLHSIEKNLEIASGLNDIRALRSSMEGCLVAVREAAAHQRATAAATEQSLREKIDRVSKVASIEEAEAEMNSVLPDLRPLDDVIPETKASSYVAVFNLQRADSIAGRFGEQVKQQMLAAIASQLKAVQGPEDRLLRWKGTSFVMFIVSTAPLREIKARLGGAVAATGKQYFELGSKSALLAVGVDWVIFPHPSDMSLEAVFAEVEAFLEKKADVGQPALSLR